MTFFWAFMAFILHSQCHGYSDIQAKKGTRALTAMEFGIDIFLLEYSSLSTWWIKVFDFPCARKCVFAYDSYATHIPHWYELRNVSHCDFTHYCSLNSRILSHVQNISRYIQMACTFCILLWSDTGQQVNFYPYSSGLRHGYRDNLTIEIVPVKQLRLLWIRYVH